jgi:hypothetical protein
LEVTVKANTTHTGLAANSIFYFGNLVADSGTGNDVDAAFTDGIDVIAARAHPASDIWDFDPASTAGIAAAMANPAIPRAMDIGTRTHARTANAARKTAKVMTGLPRDRTGHTK